MILYACVSYFMYSRFVENPLIDIEAMDPSFLRWFCHTTVGGEPKDSRGRPKAATPTWDRELRLTTPMWAQALQVIGYRRRRPRGAFVESLPMATARYGFLFCRWPWFHSGRTLEASKASEGLRNESDATTVARRLTQSRLHVVTAHWHAPLTVYSTNGVVG
jgi:hypothetical protein